MDGHRARGGRWFVHGSVRFQHRARLVGLGLYRLPGGGRHVGHQRRSSGLGNQDSEPDVLQGGLNGRSAPGPGGPIRSVPSSSTSHLLHIVTRSSSWVIRLLIYTACCVKCLQEVQKMSIVVHTIHGRQYAYVSRREGKRMIQTYLGPMSLSLIHISEPTRLGMISYAVFCLKKKKNTSPKQH